MNILAIELKSISGIPLHPLIVHIPVVLVPLAFIGAIAALAVPRWRSWCLPLTAVFTAASLAGVQLAMQSGEGLEEILNEESAAIERHSQLAEQARPFVFVFFVFAVAAAIAYHLVRKAQAQSATDAGDGTEVPVAATAGGSSAAAKMLIPFMALSIVFGGLSTVWIYRTGHSGAESVWKDAGNEGGEGGEKGERTGSGSDEKPAPAPDGDSDGD